MALCICVRMQYISVHTIRLHLPKAWNSSNLNTAATRSFFCNNTQHTNSCLLPGTLNSISQMSDAPCPRCQSPFIGLPPRRKSTLRSEKKLYVRTMKEAGLKQPEWKASQISNSNDLLTINFYLTKKNWCSVSCSVSLMNRSSWIFSDKWYSNGRNSAQWPLSGSLLTLQQYCIICCVDNAHRHHVLTSSSHGLCCFYSSFGWMH